MISVGNNKAVMCKGDFHPAALYKGDKKIAGYNVEEFEGENGVTLENCYNDKLHNAQIFGNSIQDGTPTPEAPVEVQSVGELVTEGEYAGKYKIPVTARGKNLLKPLRVSSDGIRTATSTTKTSNSYGTSINTTNAKEEIIVTQTKAPNTSNLTSYMNGYFSVEVGSGVLKHGKRYTLSFDCEITNSLLNSNKMGLYCNGDGIYSLDFQSVNGRNSIAFTYGISSGNDNYLEFRIAGKSLKISNIMITDEDGTPIYEPYIKPQTTNIYLDEPLRKVGDYADYIDADKDVVVRKIKEDTIQRSCTWYKQSNHSDYNTGAILYRYEGAIVDKRLFIGNWYAVGSLLCNGLRHTGYNAGGVIDESISERQADNGNRQIRILTSEYTTVTDMLAAFGEFKVSYILDNAYVKEEPIELPELPTFKGTTIIEVDSDVETTISGKYKKFD